MAAQFNSPYQFMIGNCDTEQGVLYIRLLPDEGFKTRVEAQKRIAELSQQEPESVFAIVGHGQI
jgi:hypothetical protein